MTARTWLITGVSSGFGRELASHLLNRGEAVAAEVAPFGIGVSIVEPGGARTEFRYGSARVADLMPEYDNTPAHAFQRMLDPAHGLAPGDPAHMAARIIDSVDIEPAPLRINAWLPSTPIHHRHPPPADQRLRAADRPGRLHRLPAQRVDGATPAHSRGLWRNTVRQGHRHPGTRPRRSAGGPFASGSRHRSQLPITLVSHLGCR